MPTKEGEQPTAISFTNDMLPLLIEARRFAETIGKILLSQQELEQQQQLTFAEAFDYQRRIVKSLIQAPISDAVKTLVLKVLEQVPLCVDAPMPMQRKG